MAMVMVMVMAPRGLELPPIQNQLDSDRNEDGRGQHENLCQRCGSNHRAPFK
jgi:hypothetical protein